MAEMGGQLSFAGGRSNGEVAPYAAVRSTDRKIAGGVDIFVDRKHQGAAKNRVVRIEGGG
jgi:hypothetical protein